MKRLNAMAVVTSAAMGLVIAAQVALAGGTLYCVRETDNVLVKIDLDTLTFSDVGPLGVTFEFGGLAWDANSSTMYCVDGRGAQSLYTIDINSGQAALKGAHGVSDLFGIAVDTSTGTLYGVQFAPPFSLYRLDTSNGAATSIGNCPVRMGGLCYNFSTDQLIGSNDGNGDLYEIDRSNGSAMLLYDGPYVNNSGLAYDPERNYLWGIDWSGNLFYYDIAAGYARTDVLTGLGAYDGLEWVGEIGGYRMRVSGPCPGTLTVSWSGATPNRQQGIVFGASAGSTMIPNGPCQGTLLGVQGQVRLVNTIGTGANGEGSINGQAGTAACGHYLQLVEAGTCNTSNVVQIP